MSVLAHLHWDMDPVLFQLGPVTVRWYGLLFGSGFLAAFTLVRWMYRREGRNPDDVETLLVWTILATIVGARLVHCLAYDPQRYLADPVSILKVWEGGLASHGGMLGIVTALFLHSRRHADQSFMWLLDRVAVGAVLGGAFVRIGNFMNSEILGTPSDVPWAVVFQRRDPLPRHPAQLYEAATYLVVFGVLFAIYRRKGARTPPGLLVGMLLVLAFGARIAIELVKRRQEAFDQELALSMGQVLSVLPVVIGLWLIWRAVRASRSPPQ